MNITREMLVKALDTGGVPSGPLGLKLLWHYAQAFHVEGYDQRAALLNQDDHIHFLGHVHFEYRERLPGQETHTEWKRGLRSAVAEWLAKVEADDNSRWERQKDRKRLPSPNDFEAAEWLAQYHCNGLSYYRVAKWSSERGRHYDVRTVTKRIKDFAEKIGLEMRKQPPGRPAGSYTK